MDESRQLALKNTEDQVKQLRDDAATQSRARSSSVRRKIASKVHNRSSKEKALPVGLSDQDIKAALGLVDESWERQEYRLQRYLQRNNNFANGIPTEMEVGDEEFERHDTAANIGGVVEKVQSESTPTVEKDIQLDPIYPDGSQESSSLQKEIEMSLSENRNIWTRPRLPS